MSTTEVAQSLVDFCRKGQNKQAVETLYADHAVSIEPDSAPIQRVEGKAGILQKGAQLNEMIEQWHGVTVSDPLIAGDFFSVAMGMDVTYKDGNRVHAKEICVYQVAEGKVISEQFYF